MKHLHGQPPRSYPDSSIEAPPVEPPFIEAVLFDYGMVLSGPPDPAAWARIRAVTGLAEPILQAAYWQHRHVYDRGTLTGPAYWQAVGAGGGVHLTGSQVAALIAADTDLWTQLNLPMVEWAARLQAARIPTGILSNLGDAMAEGILGKFPWLDHFDHCTWSHALKLAKPEAAIYRAAAEGLRTPPANILFLDDREDNIAGAAAAGLQTIRYTTHAAFEHEMHTRGLAWLLLADGDELS